MSKWKCGICGSEFENYHAQGFDDTIYCPLCYFKKLYKDTELERERLSNIIEKIRNYVYKPVDKEWGDILCIIEDGRKVSDKE